MSKSTCDGTKQIELNETMQSIAGDCLQVSFVAKLLDENEPPVLPQAEFVKLCRAARAILQEGNTTMKQCTAALIEAYGETYLLIHRREWNVAILVAMFKALKDEEAFWSPHNLSTLTETEPYKSLLSGRVMPLGDDDAHRTAAIQALRQYMVQYMLDKVDEYQMAVENCPSKGRLPTTRDQQQIRSSSATKSWSNNQEVRKPCSSSAQDTSLAKRS